MPHIFCHLLGLSIARQPVLVFVFVANVLAAFGGYWLMLSFLLGERASGGGVLFLEADPWEVVSALCAGVLALAAVNLLFRAIARAYAWWRQSQTMH